MLNVCHTQAYKRGKVDLHGLCVREALQFAEQELQSASQRGDKKVHFIVGTSFSTSSLGVYALNGQWVNYLDSGKGLHSENGRPVIRPALKTFCNKYVVVLRCRIHCSVDSPRLISDMD